MGQVIPYSELEKRRVRRLVDAATSELRLFDPKGHPWTDPEPFLPAFVKRGLDLCWECGKRKEDHLK